MALENYESPSVETKKSQQQQELLNVLQGFESEKIENEQKINENLTSLEDEIIGGDKEKLDQKNFTWDEKTKTLSYFYILGKRDVFMSLQIIGDNIKIVFDATNTLGWNYEKEDKVISINKSNIKDLPNKIKSTFDEGFDFKTAFGLKEKISVYRNDILDKIQEKAQKAINILEKYL